MIFIIGGKSQGKSQWAETFETRVVDDLERKIWNWIQENLKYIEENKEIEQRIYERIEQLIALEKDSVIVCREVGCGIVPVEKTEALWREITGRSACMIAKAATEVYKVQAGIPEKIK